MLSAPPAEEPAMYQGIGIVLAIAVGVMIALFIRARKARK